MGCLELPNGGDDAERGFALVDGAIALMIDVIEYGEAAANLNVACMLD